MAVGLARCLRLPAALWCAVLAGPLGAAEPQAPLVLERTIALPRVSGRIDHMAVDLGRQRLLVAELGNGTLDVIDLPGGRVVHRLDGLSDPQGVVYAPKADVIAVANAGDGSVRFFRGEDFAPAGRVDLKDDADNIRLDPSSGALVVGYGSGGLAVIDPARGGVVNRVKLPAHPEGFQLDPATRRAFVNLPDARQIAVLDLAAGTAIASWRVPALGANFPIAWDQASNTIAVVFRSPARLVLLNAQTGAVRLNLAACGDADDVFFDARRARIYVSCGAGEIAVFQRTGESYRPFGFVATRSGARTSLFVPELDRLFVAERAGLLGSDAAIGVYRPLP